jgi:purine-binding chemotaxis protein CheW
VANSTALSPEIANIVEAVKNREKQERSFYTEERRMQIVVFLLDGRYFAFAGETIREIVPVSQITYVPGTPACLPGVIHLRGNIESVLDMRQILSLPIASITDQSRIMLGQVGELRSGVLVDSVEDVLEIPVDALHEPPSELQHTETTFVAGETHYNGHQLILLELGKMFECILSEPGAYRRGNDEAGDSC